MRTRCSKCDYENDSRYHYCGMCGEQLPEIVSDPAPKPVRADIPSPPLRNEVRIPVPKFSALNDRKDEARAVASVKPVSAPVVASRPVNVAVSKAISTTELRSVRDAEVKSAAVADTKVFAEPVRQESAKIPEHISEVARVAESVPAAEARPVPSSEATPAAPVQLFEPAISASHTQPTELVANPKFDDAGFDDPLLNDHRFGDPRFDDHRFDDSRLDDSKLNNRKLSEPGLDEHHSHTVSGPSFLGLSNEPSSDNFQYLLEDPEAGPHRGRLLVLFLLIAIGLGLGWQWRHGAFPFAGRQETETAANGAMTNSSSSGNMSASPSEVSPAMSSNAESVSHPKTGVAESSRPESRAGESKPGNSSIPKPTDQEIGSSTRPVPERKTEVEQKKAEPPQQKNPAASAEVAETTQPAHKAPAEKIAEKPVARPEPQPRVTAASRTVVEKYRKSQGSSQDDILAADGEKYLYGRGVPQNCNRAQKDLLSAGQGSSAKAQSMLGAMYATGHCATRNLPTAYRWFAKSLRSDPSNTRLSRNLEILWNQMTPDEKQMALQSGR